MIDTVIFDLFGTLVYFNQHQRNPYVELASRVSNERIKELVSYSLTHDFLSIEEYSHFIGLPDQSDIGELSSIVCGHLDSTYTYDETKSTLESLKNRGFKLGLISNLASPYKQAVSKCDLQGFFDSIVFSCDCGYTKPDAEIYQLALSQLGSIPDNSVMIGDSYKSDVQGPIAVGIQAYQLNRNEIEMGNSVKSIKTLTELLDELNENTG